MNPSTINAWLFIAAEIILLLLLLYALWLLRKQRMINRERELFVLRLTEELQGPLARIEAASQLLQSGNKDEGADNIKVISSEGHRLNLLAANVMQVVKSREPELSAVNLHELLESCCETFSQVHPHVQLKLKTDAKHSNIKADPVQISNIIYNLLDNALKFSGELVNISVETASRGPWVYVSVSDNGRGISGKEIKHVFEPFFRAASEKESSKGFGLGLAYVKNIVKAHRGSIKAYSKPGLGSTVTMKFKIVDS